MGIKRLYNQARLVEEFIDKLLDNGDHMTEVYSAPWINGREKGFCFSWSGSVIDAKFDGELKYTHRKVGDYYERVIHGPNVFVAECRNSDDLTVTVSVSSDWDRITDAEYGARRYFSVNDYEGAARTTLELLGVPPECING